LLWHLTLNEVFVPARLSRAGEGDLDVLPIS
jgi:hypothetical protein